MELRTATRLLGSYSIRAVPRRCWRSFSRSTTGSPKGSRRPISNPRRHFSTLCQISGSVWQERRHAPTEPEISEIPERGSSKARGGGAEAIVAAAQRLFLEPGFGAISMDARCSRPSQSSIAVGAPLAGFTLADHQSLAWSLPSEPSSVIGSASCGCLRQASSSHPCWASYGRRMRGPE